MSRRRSRLPAPVIPAKSGTIGALEPEELQLIQLLAQADAERDYRAAKAQSEDPGAHSPLRPL